MKSDFQSRVFIALRRNRNDSAVERFAARIPSSNSSDRLPGRYQHQKRKSAINALFFRFSGGPVRPVSGSTRICEKIISNPLRGQIFFCS
jgi:hypothetical protein